MTAKSVYMKSLQKTESVPLWKWKGIELLTSEPQDKSYPVLDLFHESKTNLDDAVLGPGFGAGVGCGVGLGLGVVGGAGLWWNQLTPVFGIGVGCGAGVGFGFGQGFGGGFSYQALKSRLLDSKSKSKRRR